MQSVVFAAEQIYVIFSGEASRPSLLPLHWKHNRNVAPRPEAEAVAESNDTSNQTQSEAEADLPSPALHSRSYGLNYPKKDKSVLRRLCWRVFSTWHNIKVSATVSNAPFAGD